MDTQLVAADLSAPIAHRSWVDRVDRLEEWMFELPDAVFEAELLVHHFAPGVYVREIHMKAGMLIVGAEHTTEHLNIVLKGRATVFTENGMREVIAPSTITSGVGTRKVLLIHEDMIWQTVHATEETDINKLEEQLVKYSPRYLAKREGLRQLRKSDYEVLK